MVVVVVTRRGNEGIVTFVNGTDRHSMVDCDYSFTFLYLQLLTVRGEEIISLGIVQEHSPNVDSFPMGFVHGTENVSIVADYLMGSLVPAHTFVIGC